MMPSGMPPVSRRSIAPVLRRRIGIVVSGIDVGQQTSCGIILGDEGSGEATSVLAVGAGVAIHAANQLDQRAGRNGQRLQAGLEGRHQHGRGNALAGHIGDGDQERLAHLGVGARTREDIVVIAGDGVRRLGGEGDLHSRQPAEASPATARSGFPWRSAGRASSPRDRRPRGSAARTSAGRRRSEYPAR